ncbi:MAG: hypothetical protein K2X77_03050 [Candidatus Obscuribacterales bacterium]|nr:hypothetical protein [Candidatus Obscuribacterales bacterium]
MKPTTKNEWKIRSSLGANMLEFSAVFAVLILVIILPLVDLCAIPIRYFFANTAVKETIHTLALSTKFSQAQAALSSGSLLQARLNAITGVSLNKADLSLVANSAGGSSTFGSPGSVSENWLPDGKDGPYRYKLELTCDLDISPLFMIASDSSIPGLSAPFRTKIVESYAWENLSKDPNTGQFYLNE